MGAAAELVAKAVVQVDVAHAHDAHHVGVLVAEERQRAVRQRLLVALVLDVHGEVLAHDPVGHRLDLAQLLRRQRLQVREVEAQTVRRHQRTRLAHVRAQHLAQRRVQDVRAGVVAHRVAAQALVHDRLDRVADAQRARFEVPDVRHDAAVADVLRVLDHEAALGPDDLAAVAHLAAALGVERRVVQRRPRLDAPRQLRRQLPHHRVAVQQDADDRRERARRLVAHELGGASPSSA